MSLIDQLYNAKDMIIDLDFVQSSLVEINQTEAEIVEYSSLDSKGNYILINSEINPDIPIGKQRF